MSEAGNRAEANPEGYRPPATRSSEIVYFAEADTGQIKRAYHKRFAQHRLHGEWFDPHPDILAEISRLAALSLRGAA